MSPEQLKDVESSTSTILIIITSSLLTIILMIVVGVIYLYRCFKMKDDADQEAIPSIVSKIVSILFSFYGTFVHILVTYFLLYTFYFLSLADSYT